MPTLALILLGSSPGFAVEPPERPPLTEAPPPSAVAPRLPNLGSLTPPSRNREEMSAAALKVLNEPSFRRGMAFSDPTALADIRTRLEKGLHQFLFSLASLQQDHPIGFIVLMSLLSGTLIFLIWHIRFVLVRAASAARPDALLPPSLSDAAPLSWDQLLGEAEAEGRFTDAARLLLQKEVAHRMGEASVRGRRHLTVRELLDWVRSGGNDADSLRVLGDAVERALYRGDVLDSTAWARLRERHASGKRG